MSTLTDTKRRKFYWWNRQGLENFRALNGAEINILTEVESQEIRIINKTEEQGEVTTIYYRNMEQ